jgi:peptidoglycan hydrolase CwlO-like protein
MTIGWTPRVAPRTVSLALAVALSFASLASAPSRAGAAETRSASASREPSGPAAHRRDGGELADARAKLTRLEELIRSQQRDLGATQARMGQLATELGSAQAAYNETQAELTAAREALAETQAQYDAIRRRLDERAAQALLLSSGPQMEFVLESRSLADASDRIAFLNELQAADAALAKEVEANASALEDRRADLETTLHREAALVSALSRRRDAASSAFDAEQQQLQRIARTRRQAAAIVEHILSTRERRQSRRASALGADLASIGGAVAPYGQWARLFLGELGAPSCRENLVALVAWQAAEGTSAAWNPLATTLPMPGSTSFNSVGVQNYVSLAQGVDAIHQTLLRGASTYGYGAILDSLARCADASTTAGAINASFWCRGCAGGAYVTGLVPVVEAYFDRYAGDSAA